MLWRIVCAGFALLMASCGGGSGGGEAPAVAGTVLSSSIASAQTGVAYGLDIWLPPDYAKGTASYPVVYAMDCEYRFTTLVSVLQERAAQGAPPVILVNVCAGSSDRRWVDFTMPGAAAYFRFLTLELLPAIETQYRTDPTRRILSGHSLSGQFALYALYLDNPTQRRFSSIVSAECSCWYDAARVYSQQLGEPAAMEQAMYDASHDLPVRLVMAGDWQSNEVAVQAVYQRILARNYQNLRLTQPTYSQGHVPMDGPAFNDALGYIFAAR